MAQPPMTAADNSDQVARLRTQVETVMNERVTPALADAAGRAEATLCAMRGQAETTSEYIKDQPIQAVVIAAAIGFVVGRVFG